MHVQKREREREREREVKSGTYNHMKFPEEEG